MNSENTNSSYDVIVAGAGYSGAAVAAMLAAYGRRVLLLDRRERTEIGSHYPRLMLDVDTFSKSGLPRPQGDELLALLDLFYAYSPSGKVRKPIDFSSLMLDGQLFAQRLLDQGEADGVSFRQAEIKGPLLKNDQVVGVTLADGEQILAAVTIDASGNAQALLKEVVAAGLIPALEHSHLESLYGVAYRLSGQTDLGPNELHIHFCLQGGYLWRSAYDIGIGGMGHEAREREEVRKQIEDLQARFGWEIHDLIQEDFGSVPVRHPLGAFVASGFAVLGDAGFMVNSVRGGGVSAGLKGARVLADVLQDALTRQDMSLNSLWAFNVRYQQQLGAQLAYQDVMRQTLMNEPAAEMEFAFEKDLITADDIKGSLAGRLLDFSPIQKIQKGLRGAGHPALLLRLNHKLEWGKHLYEHFRQYPASPDGFPQWQQELSHLLDKVAG